MLTEKALLELEAGMDTDAITFERVADDKFRVYVLSKGVRVLEITSAAAVTLTVGDTLTLGGVKADIRLRREFE